MNLNNKHQKMHTNVDTFGYAGVSYWPEFIKNERDQSRSAFLYGESKK